MVAAQGSRGFSLRTFGVLGGRVWVVQGLRCSRASVAKMLRQRHMLVLRELACQKPAFAHTES